MDFHATLSRDQLCFSGERFAAKQLLSSLIYHRYSYRLSRHQAVIRSYEPPSIHDLNFIFFQLHIPLSLRYENARDWNIISALCITRWRWWRCENQRHVGILVGSIERAFHFSRRRISWMWFYRLSSELYFAKTGAREEPDRTGIRNYEWETSPATVLISSASCNFSSESGKALSVFIATLGPWKRKRPLFTRNSSFYCHYPSDANCYKKVHKSGSLISFKGKRGLFEDVVQAFRAIFMSDIYREN